MRFEDDKLSSFYTIFIFKEVTFTLEFSQAHLSSASLSTKNHSVFSSYY